MKASNIVWGYIRVINEFLTVASLLHNLFPGLKGAFSYRPIRLDQHEVNMFAAAGVYF